MKAFRHRCRYVNAILVWVVALSAGCHTATDTAKTVGHTATFAVGTAGTVAVAVTKTTAKASAGVATAALQTGGTLVSSAAHLASSIAQPALVTFSDVATGAVREVPWSDGLKLYAGGQAAKINMTASALQILRSGATIHTDSRQIAAGVAEPVLKPGDVVKITPLQVKSGAAASKHS